MADNVAPQRAQADPAATAAAAQAAIGRDDDATATYDPRGYAPQEDAEMERVRRYAPKGRLFEDDEDDESTKMFDSDELDYDDEDEDDRRSRKRGRYADEEEASDDDVMAERIIHWAPPITAIVCALIIVVSLIYHFVIA